MFKQFLFETRTELGAEFSGHTVVPHIPYLGHPMEDQLDDRLKRLGGEEPIHSSSPQHVYMHDLIDKMEREDKLKPGHAKVARMINNGATRFDIEQHLNSDVIDDDDENLGMDGAGRRKMINRIREKISNYQSDKPIPERHMLGPIGESDYGSPFPGKLAIQAYMAHPMHREAFTSLKTPQFHEKYIRPYTGEAWESLGPNRQNTFSAQASRLKKQLKTPAIVSGPAL